MESLKHGKERMNNNSFTLIELIVVIAIIAILAAIIAPNAFRAIEKAKIARACADFKHNHHACAALYADTGHWPTTDQNRIRDSELMSNLYGWAGWDGPYLENSDDIHSWGGTYRFWTSWNLGEGNANELTICFDRLNFNDGTVGHSPPLSSSLRIDRMNDDRDLSAGGIRTSGAYNELFWVLVWDVY
jgi:general secretion pathway protein G